MDVQILVDSSSNDIFICANSVQLHFQTSQYENTRLGSAFFSCKKWCLYDASMF
jgi:hypothetical protein